MYIVQQSIKEPKQEVQCVDNTRTKASSTVLYTVYKTHYKNQCMWYTKEPCQAKAQGTRARAHTREPKRKLLNLNTKFRFEAKNQAKMRLNAKIMLTSAVFVAFYNLFAL